MVCGKVCPISLHGLNCTPFSSVIKFQPHQFLEEPDLFPALTYFSLPFLLLKALPQLFAFLTPFLPPHLSWNITSLAVFLTWVCLLFRVRAPRLMVFMTNKILKLLVYLLIICTVSFYWPGLLMRAWGQGLCLIHHWTHSSLRIRCSVNICGMTDWSVWLRSRFAMKLKNLWGLSFPKGHRIMSTWSRSFEKFAKVTYWSYNYLKPQRCFLWFQILPCTVKILLALPKQDWFPGILPLPSMWAHLLLWHK